MNIVVFYGCVVQVYIDVNVDVGVGVGTYVSVSSVCVRLLVFACESVGVEQNAVLCLPGGSQWGPRSEPRSERDNGRSTKQMHGSAQNRHMHRSQKKQR